MQLNKNLQEINVQNMDVDLVAQMFKNYQSNVLFHLEGMLMFFQVYAFAYWYSYQQLEGAIIRI